ncbi:MAG TPA: VWA domain-containing protein [Acidobacteriaceae bacterium]
MIGPMTRFAVLLAIATPVGFAQSTAPAPASANSTAAAPSTSPQPAPAPVKTIKTNAQLVVVDVVVTDSKHKLVHGLKASDFTLTENSTSQVVKNFEEHTALTPADATKFAPMPKLPLGIFTNYTPTPANGAVNLILLDSLNTPMRDQAYVRQQLIAYLKATPPGTRVAIFGLSTSLFILQGFTSDPVLLRTVIEKGLARGSALLDDKVGGGGIQNSAADTFEDLGGDPTILANMRDFEAATQSFQLQLRAKYTLDAMNQIARYLSAIPGRKNLIWFSGSFPINILPDTSGTQANPFIAVASSEDEFRDTVALLARSQVAVYPVDARGLFNSPMTDVTTTRNYGGPKGNARMNQDNSKFFNDTAQENQTMLAMADATGGHAFLNTNDLAKAVATAIDEGSNFYTFAYTPTNPERDGKLRKIKIQLARSGMTLSYRRGYYADDPDRIRTTLKADAATTAATAPSPHETMRLAMTRGAPTPSDIILKVGVVPMPPTTQIENAPADGNQPSPKLHGPYRRYSVNFQIDPKDIVFFHGPNGKILSDFDVIIFAFTSDGELVNSLSRTIHISTTLDQVRQMFAEGVFDHEEISTPAKGEYFLRIAVHDLHRDHYGAIEVATSSVRNVVPYIPPQPSDKPK